MSQTSTNAAEDMCHVCEKINSRDSAWKQSGLSSHCVLCNRPFCKMHQTPARDDDDVCEVNHGIYHRVHHHMLPGKVFVSKEKRKEKLGDELIAREEKRRKGDIEWRSEAEADDSTDTGSIDSAK